MIVLGIDTSCDDTSVAVLENRKILSNIVSSQIKIHSKYGGVVPEIASRKHIEWIWDVTERALSEAKADLKDIDGIAVCYGPGLIGSLLVGLCFAKSLSYASGKKLIGVNHLEGHIQAV
ncbi:MAG: tRNA (adenosine(37)-N6)-threonylcarbamoyltransferase complex transferase subunit TsaD, partial [Thermodesulfovibrio sp.]|nr:tRNA (adenosine(37)-N6)-threonylcarbamoyltransferase complex transferase subunit TsaD [Thermodesulfovibrio sp.]